MSIVCKDLGSTITVEATFQTYTPFGAYALDDPDSDPLITVIDDSGVERISGVAMVNNAVGQWYFQLETNIDWRPGRYDVEIVATFTSLDERKVVRDEIILQ